jgi:hypothetical protein
MSVGQPASFLPLGALTALLLLLLLSKHHCAQEREPLCRLPAMRMMTMTAGIVQLSEVQRQAASTESAPFPKCFSARAFE